MTKGPQTKYEQIYNLLQSSGEMTVEQLTEKSGMPKNEVRGSIAWMVRSKMIGKKSQFGSVPVYFLATGSEVTEVEGQTGLESANLAKDVFLRLVVHREWTFGKHTRISFVTKDDERREVLLVQPATFTIGAGAADSEYVDVVRVELKELDETGEVTKTRSEAIWEGETLVISAGVE